MKIVFTGGGTGGHFYPLIAIAEAVRAKAREERLVKPILYYIGPSAFDQEALFENDMHFVSCPAGKWRRYTSIRNILDLGVTLFGTLVALVKLFSIYPDVVMSKGGYASLPVVLAARILFIPIVIHESDVRPGRANRFTAPFAKRIAVSFAETANAFPKKVQDRVARTGVPVRALLMSVDTEGGQEQFGTDPSVPTILVLGGSSGATRINDVVLSALPELTSFANVIHQTGKDNFASAQALSRVMLEKSEHKERYKAFPYLQALSMRKAAGMASLIISRAGMTSIAEMAHWKKPAILIPIPESVSHDQRTNAYAYAATGAASVIEEANLTENILASEARRLVQDTATATRMGEQGYAFAAPEAGAVIAEELLRIAQSHGDTR